MHCNSHHGVLLLSFRCNLLVIYLQKLYKMEGLLFLLDEDDTISAYQQRSKERPDVPSEEELQQRALSEMNHIQQIEVARGERFW